MLGMIQRMLGKQPWPLGIEKGVSVDDAQVATIKTEQGLCQQSTFPTLPMLVKVAIDNFP